MSDKYYRVELSVSTVIIEEIDGTCTPYTSGEWHYCGDAEYVHIAATYDAEWMELFERVEQQRKMMSDALIKFMPSTKTPPSE